MSPKKIAVVKPTGKSAASRLQEKATARTPKPRQRDEFGYTEGTDSSIAAKALAEGGKERTDIYRIIRERLAEQSVSGLVTRNGTEKNIPNLVATVLRQLRLKGYTTESHWRLVKDPNFVPETTDEKPKDTKSKKAKDKTEPEAKADDETVKAPRKVRKVRKGKNKTS